MIIAAVGKSRRGGGFLTFITAGRGGGKMSLLASASPCFMKTAEKIYVYGKAARGLGLLFSCHPGERERERARVVPSMRRRHEHLRRERDFKHH